MSEGHDARFRSPWAVVPILAVALSLLVLGIDREYRLKHEDNNAMHATFARNHLAAGLLVTKAHDAYVNPKNGRVNFYAHHPPGCGLLLAGAIAATGSDRPAVVRSAAVAATLLALVSLWWVVRREVGPGAALVAAAFFAVVPQAAFYGRMVNHEVLALPAIIVLVDRYFATARGGGWRSAAVMVLAAAAGAVFAWVTFFALAACAAHALISIHRPGLYPAAARTLALLIAVGLALVSLNLAHIAWVRGGDLSDLWAILSQRVGAGQDYGPFEWAHKMLGFSRRLATLSGTLAVIWLGTRWVRGLAGRVRLRSVEEIAAVFFATGLGYMVVFNWGAWQHHYWQFPLLPAVAVSLALAVTALWSRAETGPRRLAARIVLALVLVEIVATSAAGLFKRHTTPEDRVIRATEQYSSRSLPPP